MSHADRMKAVYQEAIDRADYGQRLGRLLRITTRTLRCAGAAIFQFDPFGTHGSQCRVVNHWVHDPQSIGIETLAAAFPDEFCRPNTEVGTLAHESLPFAFYARSPVVSSDGRVAGQLCVFDIHRHDESLAAFEHDCVRDFAAAASDLIADHEHTSLMRLLEQICTTTALPFSIASLGHEGGLARCTITFTSEGFRRTLGYGSAELIDAPLHLLLGEPEFATLDAEIAGSSGRPSGIRYTTTLRGRDGTPILASVEPTVIRSHGSAHSWLILRLPPLETGLLPPPNRPPVDGWSDVMTALFETAPFAIIVTDVQGTVRLWNPGAERLFGWSSQEVLNCPMPGIPQQLAWDYQELLSMQAKGIATHAIERQRQHKDGSRLDVVLWASPLTSLTGEVSAVITVLIDVSAKRRVERQLFESQERYRLMTLASADIIAEYDAQTRTVSCSERIDRLGYSPAEVGSDTAWWVSRVHPDDSPRIDRQLSEFMLSGREHWAGEMRFLRKDGSYAYLLVRAHMLPQRGSSRGRLLIALVDVTDLRLSEAARDESERRYRLLFEHNPQPMWVYDVETLQFLAVNPAATQVYGYTEEEFLQMNLRDIRPPEEHGRLARRLPVEGFGPHHLGIYRHQAKSGAPIFADIHTHTLTFEGRPAKLVLAANVTRQVTLEDQLRQAQKMEAIGQLAGGIAHDFNNLLTVINGYASVLLSRETLPANIRREVSSIAEAGDKAALLTQQLLAFSRKQVLRPALLNCNTVIEGMRPVLERLIRENIRTEFDLDPALPNINADRSQLEQVILNLVINASDAMPEGGTLRLETASVQVEDPTDLEDGDIAPGRYVVLAVRDTGSGMDEHVRSRIFEPFFTTKEQGRGTGLGLPTVYGIVKQSGGAIHVQTAVGQGSCFRVFIPVSRGTPPAGPVVLTEPRARSLTGHETVLLVEDSRQLRELIEQALKANGYRVLSAADGEEALQICSESRLSIHLIVTDLILPHINGRELVNRVKATRPDLKALFISGYADAPGIAQVKPPSEAFLAKPFSPVVLMGAARKLLDQRQGPISLLVVDDDPEVLQLLTSVFNDSRYVVRTADNGRIAVEMMREAAPDVVITDLAMPEQEGLETIRQIRSLFPSTRVVAMSGAFQGSFLKIAELLGAHAVVPKPVDVEKLRETIQNLAD